MSGMAVSHFSLQLFDSNLCLNCSTEFEKNGTVQVEKINFIEVVDERNNKHEILSIAAAVNTVLRLPPSKRINEEEGLVFGCCLDCTNVLSRLCELHKKLDALRSLSSVITTIMNMDRSENENTTLDVNSGPEDVPVIITSRSHQSSEIIENEESMSLTLTCDEILSSSDSEVEPVSKARAVGNAVLNVSTGIDSKSEKEVGDSILIIADPASAEKCPNCCIDLTVQSGTGVFQSMSTSSARRGVDAVLHRSSKSSTGQITGVSEKILVSDMLDNLLKLPRQNPWTRKLLMCSDCAIMLLQVHVALKRFESAGHPGSRLKEIFHDLSVLLRRRRTLAPSVFAKGITNNLIPKPDSTVPTVSDPVVKRTPASRNYIGGVTEKTRHCVVTSAGRLKDISGSGNMSDKDSFSDSEDDRQQTQGNESDSSWSIKSLESSVSVPLSRAGVSTRAMKSAKSVKCSTSVSESTGDSVTAKQQPPEKRKRFTAKQSRITVHGSESESELDECSATSQRNVRNKRNRRGDTYVEEPIPPKKTGRKPRKPILELRNCDDEESFPPRRRKTGTKVLSLEKREERRIRGRADYHKKLGNAEKIIHKPCPHCGKIMKNKSKFALEVHIRRNHQHIGYHLCSICGKPYDGIYQKLQHEKTHLSAAERSALKEVEPPPTPKWLCVECGKGFLFENQLKKHSKTHADIEERRVQCPHCDFKCVCPRSMRSHIARTHDPSTSPRYNCKVCNQGFQFFNDLKEHGMKSCDASNRPFVCDQEACTSRFKLKHGLMQHLHRSHPFTVEQAREKLYPGLPCPDWVSGKYPRKKKVNKPRRVAKY